MSAILTRRGLRPLPQERQRIDRLGVGAQRRFADPDLEVEVRPIAAASAAELPDDLTGMNVVPELYRRRLQHVHVDEAVVAGGAVEHYVVAAAAVVGIAVLPSVDDDAVVDRDLGRPGLAEDVLALVDVAVTGCAELGDLVAEVVWAEQWEDIAADQARGRSRVDAEERGAVDERLIPGCLAQPRDREAEEGTERRAERQCDGHGESGLGGRPDESPAPRRDTRAPADRSLNRRLDASRGGRLSEGGKDGIRGPLPARARGTARPGSTWDPGPV